MWPFKQKEKNRFHHGETNVIRQGMLKKGDVVKSEYNAFDGEQIVIDIEKKDWTNCSYNEGNIITVSNCKSKLYEKYLTKC